MLKVFFTFVKKQVLETSFVRFMNLVRALKILCQLTNSGTYFMGICLSVVKGEV